MRDITPAPLVGLAIGDSLGMPFEQAAPDRPDLVAWDGRSYLGDTPSSDYHGLKPGQWTDDTQMSCCLARSLVRCNGFDTDDVAAEYLRWFQSGDCRGIGGNTRRAMQRLAAGERPSGIEGATGNGTAMRAMPLGVWFAGDAPAILRTTNSDAFITHGSHEAHDGSLAIALSVSWLLGLGPQDRLTGYLGRLLPPGALLTAIQADRQPVGPISSYVVDSVAAAIWCFVHTPDYLSAISTAIRLGGDTDSVAAMTGALAGTYYGYEGVPRHLLDGLEGFNELQNLEWSLLRA